MENGLTIYECIENHHYLEDLFKTVIKMRNENHLSILDVYITMTLDKIDYLINRFLKICVPSIYIFVAFFIISVYITIIIPMMNMMSEL